MPRRHGTVLALVCIAGAGVSERSCQMLGTLRLKCQVPLCLFGTFRNLVSCGAALQAPLSPLPSPQPPCPLIPSISLRSHPRLLLTSIPVPEACLSLLPPSLLLPSCPLLLGLSRCPLFQETCTTTPRPPWPSSMLLRIPSPLSLHCSLRYWGVGGKSQLFHHSIPIPTWG